MAAVAGNRRAHLPVRHLRLVAALAAALSSLIAVTCFLLLNGGDASLDDEVSIIVTVLVVLVLAPGAIAGGFAAWRSRGWMPHVEDAVPPLAR
jgi:peptidoglycan/LPS O-acetylase OafA/YrhL